MSTHILAEKFSEPLNQATTAKIDIHAAMAT